MKSLLSTTGFLAALTAAVSFGYIAPQAHAATVATTIAPANLQGYWQFDETNPTLSNPTPDQSGNSRDGTYQSSAVRVTDGTFSPAVLGGSNLTLRTANAPNREVAVNGPTPQSAFGIGGSFSVSFWVKVAVEPQNAPVMVAYRSAGVGGWRIGYNDGPSSSDRRYYIGHQVPGEAFLYNDVLATPGSWQFLTYTYDSATTTGLFYIDGVIKTMIPINTFGTPLSPGSNTLTMGGSHGGGDLFDGYLDEVAIWNVALSGAQVGTLYSSYIPEPASMTLLSLGAILVLRRRRA